MAIVSLGFLARIDAGKTGPTERILNGTLIDTLGHADFLVVVGRSPRELDWAALVNSPGEGVRLQARRIARAERAAKLPLPIFVDKVDRLAAGVETRSFPCTVFGR
jgi:translation elongation factor EF-G